MLEREQPAAHIEADADGIEAKLRRTSALELPLCEPLSRHRADLAHVVEDDDHAEHPTVAAADRCT